MSAVPAVIEESSLTDVSATALLMDNAAMGQIMKLADLMASSVVTVPKHLQGNPGDCAAVIMQSMQWRMNPYAVAQKTHISQSGQLGYEAQLINAVVSTLAPIKGRPDYEWLGDWSKILGRVEERKSDRGGKYYVAAWKPEDEAGLGVIIHCTLRGESAPRSLQVMMSQAYPRFSTQWATDPQQQIGYLGIRKWARRFTPDVLLGVYTPDELTEARERDMGAAEVVQPAGGTRTDQVKSLLAGRARPVPAEPSPLQAFIDKVNAVGTLEALRALKADGEKLPEADRAAAGQAFKERRAFLRQAHGGKAETIDQDTGEITQKPFLLAHFIDGARAAAAGGRTALLDYSADYLARLPEGQHGEADEAVQQLLRGLTD